MTLKLLSIIFCVSLPSAGLAQEWDYTKLPGNQHRLACHKGDPTKCAMILEAGEKAPIGGVLQTTTQAAAVAAKADPKLIEQRIKLEVRTATQTVANDFRLTINTLQADNVRLTDILAVTENNNKRQLELVTPAWYESPWFVAPVAVVGTLVVIGAGVAISCKLSGCGGGN